VGIPNRIKGLCFDTTASNTGVIGGVCLQSELSRELLNLTCRHHVLEIVLEKVFSLNDASRSPSIEIFGQFRDYWPRVNQTGFFTAMQDHSMRPLIAPWKDSIIEFAEKQLLKFHPRNDYCELLH